MIIKFNFNCQLEMWDFNHNYIIVLKVLIYGVGQFYKILDKFNIQNCINYKHNSKVSKQLNKLL